MTCYISDDAISTLKDGIETVLIPIRHPLDKEDLAFHAQRGGTYDVVEWLLSQLHRDYELERVCGLSVSPQANVIVVTLEMRQPGKQLEAWVREYTGPGHGRMLTRPNDGRTLTMDSQLILSARALSEEKFTDTHRPWWEKEMYSCPFCGSSDLEYDGERTRDKLHCLRCGADFGAGRRTIKGLVGLEVPAAEPDRS